MIGDPVHVHNRAPYPITIVKDGRSHILKPGPGYLRGDLITLGKNQNPIPGTEDPNTTVTASFLAVIGPDPAHPLEPTDDIPIEVIQSLPKERLNRMLLPPDRHVSTSVHRPDFPTRRVGVETPTPGMYEAGQKF